MGFIIDGELIDIPGVPTANWHDNPKMELGPTDKRARQTRWIRSLILHTTVGDEPQIVLPGSGTPGMAARTVAAWASDPNHAGSHLLVDGDGSIWCVADLIRDATYHATSINEVSIGIEICQTRNLEIRQIQIQNTILAIDALTRNRKIRIQRQLHAPYHGSSNPVPRLAAGGWNCVGIFGHRDQTDRRGAGDPGDAIGIALRGSGYEAFDFSKSADLDVWKQRQAHLAGTLADGVPGPATVAALAASGHPHGLWVSRPGD